MLERIGRWRQGLLLSLSVVVILISFAGGAVAVPALIDDFSQTTIAYSLDYEMDRARGDQTIEHYGESVREPVEQAMRNNVNHPERKDTAENSYGRKSFMNSLLPKRHKVGKAFSQDDFSSMRKIKHPREALRRAGGAPIDDALE